MLIASKASVDLVHAPDAPTPLFVAAGKGNVACLRPLVEGGADVNFRRDEGWSPLSWAVCKGQVDAARELLDLGANVNVCRDNGCSALYIASDFGHSDAAQALLAGKADPNRTSVQGCTPLYIASLKGHDDVVRALLVDRLDTGLDLDMACANGKTALFVAADEGRTDCVRILATAKANVDKPREQGWTPLTAAAATARVDMVRLLLEVKAGINVPRSETGSTAVCIAAELDHDGVMEALIAAGASVNDGNAAGVSPLRTAAQHGHLGPLRALLAAGADPHEEILGETAVKMSILPNYEVEETDVELCLVQVATPEMTAAFAATYPPQDRKLAVRKTRDERLKDVRQRPESSAGGDDAACQQDEIDWRSTDKDGRTPLMIAAGVVDEPEAMSWRTHFAYNSDGSEKVDSLFETTSFMQYCKWGNVDMVRYVVVCFSKVLCCDPCCLHGCTDTRRPIPSHAVCFVTTC